MSRAALLVSTAAALVMCATSANAQMQQKQPEGAAPSQAPSAPATSGEQRVQQDTPAPADKGTEPAQRKAEPKKAEPKTEPKTKGAAQGETKGQPGKGTAQSEPQSAPKDTPKKDTAQTPPKEQGTKGRAATEPADKGTKGSAQTESKDKATKGTASDTSKGAAPKAADQATGPAGSGARVQLSEQQRTNLHQTILKERNVNRLTNVNVAINVGTRMPRSVRLVALPASIIAIVPAYRNYRYFVVDDRICIVDPGSYEIVEVIVADGGQTARVEGRGSAALVLTEEEQAVILREVDMRDGSTLALGALTEGSDAPRGVEVRTFPAAVVQQVPKLRNYKFFTAENRIAIVDPQGAKVQLVIEIVR